MYSEDIKANVSQPTNVFLHDTTACYLWPEDPWLYPWPNVAADPTSRGLMRLSQVTDHKSSPANLWPRRDVTTSTSGLNSFYLPQPEVKANSCNHANRSLQWISLHLSLLGPFFSAKSLPTISAASQQSLNARYIITVMLCITQNQNNRCWSCFISLEYSWCNNRTHIITRFLLRPLTVRQHHNSVEERNILCFSARRNDTCQLTISTPWSRKELWHLKCIIKNRVKI